jgi:DNA polymerase I-like protein with 3'-5' exonuclease and polymerase domains
MRTLALDVETTKRPYLHPWQKKACLVAVGLADETGWRKTWVFNHDELNDNQTQREKIDEIQQQINLCSRIVGHNLKFDLNWIRDLGVMVAHCKLWCTQVSEYLLSAQRIGNLSLADLSKKYLRVDKIDRVKTMWEAGYETTEIPLRILLPYLEQDCINALAIYQKQVPLIKDNKLVALAAIQNENSRVLSEIESNGMLLNVDEAMRQVKSLRLKLDVLDTDIKMAVGYDLNLSSGPELSAALYGGTIKRPREEWIITTLKSKPESTYKMKIVYDDVKVKGAGFAKDKKLKTKKEGVYKTDKNTIKFLTAKTKKQRNLKKWLVERSGVAKALETLLGKDDSGIINKVQADGFVHPQYNMTVTKTGRLSSKEPNGQNLPREGTSPVKLSFVSRFDYILECDISKAEWVGVAVLSRDPVMMKEIHGGIDPHTENAINFFGGNPTDGKKFDKLRTTAKIMTFRLIYGGSAYSFYMDQKMPNYSLKKWEQIVQEFYAKYKGLAAWQAENVRRVWRQHGELRNPTGRIFRFFKGPKGYRPQQIKNFPVQAFATADVMPLAMTVIYKRFKKAGFKSLMIGQVHDSLIFDVYKEEMESLAEMCKDVFEHIPEYIEQLWPEITFDLPMTGDAEYGESWGDLTKLKMVA